MITVKTKKYVVRWSEKNIYNYVETYEGLIAQAILEKIELLGYEFTYSIEYVEEKIEGV